MKRQVFFYLCLGFLVILFASSFLSSVIAAEDKQEWYDVGDDSSNIFWTSEWAAQTFTPRNAINITAISIKVFRTGSPGTLYVSIVKTDALGLPTSAEVSSGTIDANTFSSSSPGTWKNITMTEATLSKDKIYAIVLHIGGGVADWVAWRCDRSSASYPRGLYAESGNAGISWISYSDSDFMFIVYGYVVVSPPEEAEFTGISLANIPIQLANVLGISEFVAKMILSSITIFAFILPVVVLSKKPSPMAVGIIGVAAESMLVGMGWLDVWLLLLTVLVVVILFSGKIADWLGK